MTLAEEIREHLADDNPEAVLWDGLDGALIGWGVRCGQPTVAVYDYDKAVGVLVEDGMGWEEAEVYLDFDVVGAWAGESTPIMLVRPEEEVWSNG